MRDSRLVQTAVIGDEHSDVPVVLPPEAIELDAFRHTHQGDTLWCGVLLGGCGAQLATKLYIDRQCHFQHFPQPNGMPNTCRRPAVGESSADHLYVKSAMSRLLLDHGRAARFAFPPPIGSMVDVDLEDGTALRIHMDGSVRPDGDDPERTVVLGPGVVLDPARLAGCPYVYRVRCDSDGATRRVWIGTQSLAHPTEWVPLSECAWTGEGLLTPAASRILQERSADRSRLTAPAPSTARGVLPESVVTFVRGLEAAQRTGTVDHVRRLCNGSTSFLDSLGSTARAEAERALEEAKGWLATHEEYQRRIFRNLEAAVRERRAWDVRSGIQQAASLTRRGASAEEHRILAAARAYLREHDYAGQSPAQAAVRRQLHYRPVPPAPKRAEPSRSRKPNRAKEAAATARALLERLDRESDLLADDELAKLVQELTRAANVAGPHLKDPERDRATRRGRRARRRRPARTEAVPPRTRTKPPAAGKPESWARVKLDPLAAAVKTILQKAAATGTTLTWPEIRAQLPPGLPALERSQQTGVLIQVDRSRPGTAPLLSALVTGVDHDMHPAYPRLAAAAGRPQPRGDLEAVAQWAVEVSRFPRAGSK
ncbi:hypothetical protein ABZZ79_37235 [Streptomyces sp. NPDC006458]|uniref:hypothetical protein n=1 Tax=Streptomyces sp. NPDC006458 TaxID=3154302 RepID=UPI00339E9765